MSSELTIANALGLYRHGRLREAQALCEQVLREHPQQLQALYLCIEIAVRAQDSSGALTLLDQAVALDRQNAVTHFNRGVILQELKRLDEALVSYGNALDINPAFPEALLNRAVAQTQLGDFDAAIESCTRAIELRGELAEGYFNRGNARFGRGQLAQALADYNQALARRRDYAEAFHNRGNVEAAMRHWEAARRSYDEALRLRPGYVTALVNRANVSRERQEWQEALAGYDRVIALDPGCAEAYLNRADVQRELKQFEAAVGGLVRVRQLDRGLELVLGRLIHARLEMCDWSHLSTELAELAAGFSGGARVATPFDVLACVDSPALQLRAAQVYVRPVDPQRRAAPGRQRLRGNDDRICVGYFSADFHDHATAHLITEVLELHDARRFRIIAFSFGAASDGVMRRRIGDACHEFIDISGQSDLESALLARRLEVDIAVDLKGYTTHGRHGIFAARAAPLQVSFLGYPSTMGAAFIDYLVADRTLIPEETRGHYSEKIIYLPDTYQSNDRKRPISERVFTRGELQLPSEGMVFCCFNNNWKIQPETFAVWMRILRQVSGSVLWLLQGNPAASDNLRRAAQLHGVAAERLIFAPRLGLPEHLARHRAADLFLDTLPCNAHTTASDALWAGLPVLTCPGLGFAARVAASLLKAAGLPELVAADWEDYANIAIGLAGSPGRLADLRLRLAHNRLTCALFDTPRYCRNLEAAYRLMCERHDRGDPPEDLEL
jgi:predicted O-linked N-acetylglucosamine transferase (SPINDLY family)